MKIALPLLVLLASCGRYASRPLQKQKADNNKTYQVEYLFEHDGCKVYRFLSISAGMFILLTAMGKR